jgi:hypothetical protein
MVLIPASHARDSDAGRCDLMREGQKIQEAGGKRRTRLNYSTRTRHCTVCEFGEEEKLDEENIGRDSCMLWKGNFLVASS